MLNKTEEVIFQKLWTLCGLDGVNDVYDYFYNHYQYKQIFESYVTTIASDFPSDIQECDKHFNETLEKVCLALLDADIPLVYQELMQRLAELNDITKVKSKSLPKARRDFYELKAKILRWTYNQHSYRVQDLWWEEDRDGHRYLVLSLKGGWVFHQPERYFRDDLQRHSDRLASLPTRPYHREPQTETDKAELAELTVGEYEKAVAWLNILYDYYLWLERGIERPVKLKTETIEDK